MGVTVAELDPAIDFFTELGLELEGRRFLEDDLAMMRPPGGGTAIELSTYGLVGAGSADAPAP